MIFLYKNIIFRSLKLVFEAPTCLFINTHVIGKVIALLEYINHLVLMFCISSIVLDAFSYISIINLFLILGRQSVTQLILCKYVHKIIMYKHSYVHHNHTNNQTRCAGLEVKLTRT